MFREMRRFKQALAPEECEEILLAGARGVLAVLGDDGYPYTVPLDYTYEDGCLFFHSAVEGHKLDAIDAYDKASFCVLDEGTRAPDEWWYVFRSVICFGRVNRVTDPAELHDRLYALGAKYFPPEVDIEADITKNFGRVVMLKLTVEHMSGKHVTEK